jgi:hypothetical protein
MSRGSAPAGASWRRWALAASLLAMVSTVAAVALLTRRRPARADREPAAAGEPAPDAAAMPESDRLFMSGVEYAAYEGSEPAFRLSARTLIHRKRRFGPLTLNPVKEVEMDGVRIEIYPAEGTGGRARHPLTLDGILEGTLLSKSLGYVSRVRLRDLVIDDRRGGDGVAGSRLTTGEAVWSPGARRLEIAGTFEYADETGTHQGTNGAFALTDEGRLRRVR